MDKEIADFFEGIPGFLRANHFDKPSKVWPSPRELLEHHVVIADDVYLSHFEQACDRQLRYMGVVVPEIKALRRIGAHHKIPRLPAPKLTRSQVEAVFRMVRRDGERGRIVAADLLGNAVAPLLSLMVRKDKLAFRQQLVGGAL